jgi:hypothetical protein
MSALHELHDTDYSAWAKRMAELLKAGKFAELDIEHLVEELDDMSASERNELENRLAVLLTHLLKWQFQYRKLSERWQEFKGDSWRYTLIEQRDRIAKRLRKAPGLQRVLAETIAEAYADARELAAEETRLPLKTFPEICPYTQAQILDKDFYPAME